MVNTYSAEPIPPEILKDILDDNWVEFEKIPKPYIIEANSTEEPYARVNIRSGDYVIIRQDPAGLTTRMRGTYRYYDRVFTLILELYTSDSRQRLYDMMAMIRKIIFTKQWDTDNNQYQLIRFGSFAEILYTELNIWHGQIRITFEDLGKCIDTIS